MNNSKELGLVCSLSCWESLNDKRKAKLETSHIVELAKWMLSMIYWIRLLWCSGIFRLRLNYIICDTINISSAFISCRFDGDHLSGEMCFRWETGFGQLIDYPYTQSEFREFMNYSEQHKRLVCSFNQLNFFARTHTRLPPEFHL